ncbi:MAG: TfoX/Sxy family protein, partial [Pseudomonadota bacterium]
MARHSEFVEFVLELLTPIGAVRARAMFGGFGIYRGDTFFAIIVDDKLYFKADNVTCSDDLQRIYRTRTVSIHVYGARQVDNDAILRSPAGSIRGIGG